MIDSRFGYSSLCLLGSPNLSSLGFYKISATHAAALPFDALIRSTHKGDIHRSFLSLPIHGFFFKKKKMSSKQN